jgi:hypothetical protein
LDNQINQNIGLKIHKPYIMIYNFFLKDLTVGVWKNITIPLDIKDKQEIIFIFGYSFLFFLYLV